MVYECPDLVAEMQSHFDELKRAEERSRSTGPCKENRPWTAAGAERLMRALFDRRSGLNPDDQEWLDDLHDGYVEPTEEERRAELSPKSTDDLLIERHKVAGEIIYFVMIGGDRDAHKMLDECIRHLKVIDDVLLSR